MENNMAVLAAIAPEVRTISNDILVANISKNAQGRNSSLDSAVELISRHTDPSGAGAGFPKVPLKTLTELAKTRSLDENPGVNKLKEYLLSATPVANLLAAITGASSRQEIITATNELTRRLKENHTSELTSAVTTIQSLDVSNPARNIIRRYIMTKLPAEQLSSCIMSYQRGTDPTESRFAGEELVRRAIEGTENTGKLLNIFKALGAIDEVAKGPAFKLAILPYLRQRTSN